MQRKEIVTSPTLGFKEKTEAKVEDLGGWPDRGVEVADALCGHVDLRCLLRVKSGVHERRPGKVPGLVLAHHFLKDIAMTTTTPSGLQYDDTVLGTGAIAKAGQNVKVHYTGWLYNDGVQGAKFDSSKDRGQPFEFSLGAGQVIKGWDEGVQGMSVGGTRRLIIPAGLGYGARGAGGVIPPHATLLFEVDFLGT